ncbi:proteasome subunit beta type-5 [Drosophila ficusphila]|uniref:proteasome subunit beta type-5 n=1 Tax=Drosophila ficusphila TaxID=30025 RepID=UPI001C8B077F|nr:proteasome subunit beta type-5 [Drosophila ficusphila]
MALEQICGMDKPEFMKGFGSLSSERTIEQIKLASSNLDNPFAIMAPPFERPQERLNELAVQNNLRIDFNHGTTTLGFIYKGGIILCVDSRATSGKFIGSQTMQKVVQVNKYMLSTMAGGAADCTYWDRVLARESRLHELRYKERLSVRSAARFICNVAAEYKGTGLCMGMMLAGWSTEGPSLVYVDSEGLRIHGKVFAVGSGASYALGILDTDYHHNLTDKEAYDLAFRAVYHATMKDIFSGGLVRLYHMNQSSWRNVANKDCQELHEKYSTSVNNREVPGDERTL